MGIENPISWLKSKRAISDNPISWLNLKLHYKKFEETVSTLNDEQLKLERSRYRHQTCNDVAITGLALAAETGVILLVGPYVLLVNPHVGPIILALSWGPAAAAACLVGINRGIIRHEEKEILQEEIDRRSQSPII